MSGNVNTNPTEIGSRENDINVIYEVELQPTWINKVCCLRIRFWWNFQLGDLKYIWDVDNIFRYACLRNEGEISMDDLRALDLRVRIEADEVMGFTLKRKNLAHIDKEDSGTDEEEKDEYIEIIKTEHPKTMSAIVEYIRRQTSLHSWDLPEVKWNELLKNGNSIVHVYFEEEKMHANQFGEITFELERLD
jgi:hypothetical protein